MSEIKLGICLNTHLLDILGPFNMQIIIMPECIICMIVGSCIIANHIFTRLYERSNCYINLIQMYCLK